MTEIDMYGAHSNQRNKPTVIVSNGQGNKIIINKQNTHNNQNSGFLDPNEINFGPNKSQPIPQYENRSK